MMARESRAAFGSLIVTVGVLLLAATAVHAQPLCGDADGNGQITDTDGVNVLRAAALLPSRCTLAACDVDGDGQISDTDGVNVLRAAAGLASLQNCTGNRFVDNLDGTVTDTETGLQWEQKTGSTDDPTSDCSITSCSDPHAVGNLYPWCLDANHDLACDTAGSPPDGGTFTDFLAGLNAGSGFAGHTDWRLPTLEELQSIVGLAQGFCGGAIGACIDPVFGPTIDDSYWSSTTDASDPGKVRAVSFEDGSAFSDSKGDIGWVRAVRGPS